MFLVPLYRDLRLQKLVKQPVVIFFGGDVSIIPKDVILCDVCNNVVAVEERDLELGDRLPIGYALCDDEYILEVVCEECRRKHFQHLRCYNDLEEALGR